MAMPKAAPRNSVGAVTSGNITKKQARELDALDPESLATTERLKRALESDDLAEVKFGAGDDPGAWDEAVCWLKEKSIYNACVVYFKQMEPEEADLPAIRGTKFANGEALRAYLQERYSRPDENVRIRWKLYADNAPRRYGYINLLPREVHAPAPAPGAQQPPPGYGYPPPPPWYGQQQPQQQQQPQAPTDSQLAPILLELVKMLGQGSQLTPEQSAQLQAAARGAVAGATAGGAAPAPMAPRNELESFVETADKVRKINETLGAMAPKPAEAPAAAPAAAAVERAVQTLETPDGITLVLDKDGDLKLDQTALMAGGFLIEKTKEILKQYETSQINILREKERILKETDRDEEPAKQTKSNGANGASNGAGAGGVDYSDMWND